MTAAGAFACSVLQLRQGERILLQQGLERGNRAGVTIQPGHVPQQDGPVDGGGQIAPQEAGAHGDEPVQLTSGAAGKRRKLPGQRGKGYGERVTRALLQLCADSGMAYATLECRRSNTAAQNLYHKVGFVDVGYRKRFYQGVEDALIMLNQHLPEGNPDNDPFLQREPEGSC